MKVAQAASTVLVSETCHEPTIMQVCFTTRLANELAMKFAENGTDRSHVTAFSVDITFI